MKPEQVTKNIAFYTVTIAGTLLPFVGAMGAYLRDTMLQSMAADDARVSEMFGSFGILQPVVMNHYLASYPVGGFLWGFALGVALGLWNRRRIDAFLRGYPESELSANRFHWRNAGLTLSILAVVTAAAFVLDMPLLVVVLGFCVCMFIARHQIAQLEGLRYAEKKGTPLDALP